VQRIEHQGFLLLLTAVTLAFAWVLYPFYGAVLWAVVVAVLFAPVHRRLLQSMQGRPSLAAAVTVLIIIAMVILPLAMIAASLVQERRALSRKSSQESIISAATCSGYSTRFRPGPPD
jgi:predicted PurR-regulated permease PerM